MEEQLLPLLEALPNLQSLSLPEANLYATDCPALLRLTHLEVSDIEHEPGYGCGQGDAGAAHTQAAAGQTVSQTMDVDAGQVPCCWKKLKVRTANHAAS